MSDNVLTGDCLRLLAEQPGGSVDLAFADPPFNIGGGSKESC
jgi:DNA modification methylase